MLSYNSVCYKIYFLERLCMYKTIIVFIACVSFNSYTMEEKYERRFNEAKSSLTVFHLCTTERELECMFDLYAKEAPHTIVDLTKWTDDPSFAKTAYALLPKYKRPPLFAAIRDNTPYLSHATSIDKMRHHDVPIWIEWQLQQRLNMTDDAKKEEEKKLIENATRDLQDTRDRDWVYTF